MILPYINIERQRLNLFRWAHLFDKIPVQELHDAVWLAARFCNSPIAVISFLDESGQLVSDSVGLEQQDAPCNFAFWGHTVRQANLLNVPDARLDERFATNPWVTGWPHITFFAGVPLSTADGCILGSLCVFDRVPRFLTEEQKIALKSLGHLAVTQMELRQRIADHARLQDTLVAPPDCGDAYSHIVENAPGVAYQAILNADGSFSIPFISSGCQDIFGLESAAIVADPRALLNLIHPDDRPEFDKSLARSAHTLRPWRWDGQVVTAGGRVVRVQCAASLEPQTNGDIVCEGLIVDVTGSKIVEESLQSQISARNRSELELQRVLVQTEQILAAISSILITVDRNGIITTWNTAAATAFGVPASVMLGTQFSECNVGWDRDLINRSVETCVRDQVSVRVDDVRLTAEDGREWFLGVTLNPIDKYCDAPQGFLLLCADVTKRRIMEAQLAQSQKLKSIGQLAAGVAHEINTPIQYVSDNTRFLSDSVNDLHPLLDACSALAHAARNGEDTADKVSAVVEAERDSDLDYLLAEMPKAVSQSLDGIDQVSHIVHAMKDFSHPGTDAKVATDLNRALESTAIISRNEWKYVAELVTDFDPDLPRVPCLSAEMNQVFLNMIVNAAHAIADVVGDGAERKGTITLRTCLADEHVEVRIQDTGKGMTEEIKGRVFDPFFTTKPPGKGTGQGLAISHSVVVDKHGGAIHVETKPGQGTTFIIRLPVIEQACNGHDEDDYNDDY